VGGMIIVTNTFSLMRTFDIAGAAMAIVLGGLALVWIALVAMVTRQHFAAKRVTLADASSDTASDTTVGTEPEQPTQPTSV